MSNRYLGFDPSSVSTGWAILSEDGSLIAYGAIAPGKELTEHENIVFQYKEFLNVMTTYQVTHIGCEDAFLGPNPKTYKMLVRIASNVIVLGGLLNIPVEFYTPSQWRKVTHGDGKVTKPYTRKLANEMFNKNFLARENDITDAVGISAAHRIVCRDIVIRGV